MMFETRKILEDESIGVAVTCVRVPVRVGHSRRSTCRRASRCRAEEAPRLLARRPGRDRSRTCRRRCSAEGRDEVFVGRIRRDDSHPRALSMWVVGDNLRKGAATNAVQIAEVLVEREPLRGLVTRAAPRQLTQPHAPAARAAS